MTTNQDCSSWPEQDIFYAWSTKHEITIGRKQAIELMDSYTKQRIALQEKIDGVVELITRYGYIGGDHHKQWVLDQIIRALMGDRYNDWVGEYEDGEDGPNTYDWDTGIAP